MKLIIRDIANQFIKSISFQKFDFFQDFLNEKSSYQSLAKATLISANEKLMPGN